MSTAAQSLARIRACGVNEPIDVAMVLGTGLGGLADAVEHPVILPYSELPGFPASGVSGHAGRLVIGMLEGVRVAFAQGRAHYYEHGDPRAMAVPIETFAALGARTLVLSNACGALRADWRPGSLVVLNDHINYAGVNPLIGIASDSRFVSMTNAYAPALRQKLHASAQAAGITVQEGVYIWYSGPSFETPAEIRMARVLGADVIGMSTVPEVILARHLGMEVAAVSLVTNLAAGIEGASPSHAETKEVAHAGAARFERLIRGLLRQIAEG